MVELHASEVLYEDWRSRRAHAPLLRDGVGHCDEAADEDHMGDWEVRQCPPNDGTVMAFLAGTRTLHRWSGGIGRALLAIDALACGRAVGRTLRRGIALVGPLRSRPVGILRRPGWIGRWLAVARTVAGA